MTKYKEGIYFGISDEEYHAIPYFNQSTARQILIDEEEVKVKKEQTDSMSLGSLVHTALLEPSKFARDYIRHPNFKDYQGFEIIEKTNQIKDILKENGQKVSGLKGELIERVKPFLRDNQIIWDYEIEKFNEKVEANNQTVVKNETWELIENIQESLRDRPKIKSLLQGGVPEITLIWKDEFTDIKCKGRIDYLKPDLAIELKTFSFRPYSKSLDQYLNSEFLNRKYNMQYAIYNHALHELIKKKAPLVGNVPDDFKEKFLLTNKKKYCVIYVRTEEPYQIKVKELQDEFNYYTNGIDLFRKGIDKYAYCQEKWGEDVKKWVEDGGKILKDDDLGNGVIYQTNEIL